MSEGTGFTTMAGTKVKSKAPEIGVGIGHIIGWEHTFVHELTHFLDCIVNDKDVAPYGATFEDGYRAAVICDAILESAETKKQVDINY